MRLSNQSRTPRMITVVATSSNRGKKDVITCSYSCRDLAESVGESCSGADLSSPSESSDDGCLLNGEFMIVVYM